MAAEHSDDTARAILAAARTCFERHGVAHTRIADVAAVASISRPLVYLHFRDRGALIEAMIDDELARLVQRLRRRIPRQASFADCFVRLSVASVDLGRRDALLADLLANSTIGDLTAQLLRPDRPAHQMVLDLWRPVLGQGREEGALRPEVPDDVVVEWIMMVHHVFFVRDDLPLSRVAEMLEAFVVPGLRPGGAEVPALTVVPRRRGVAPAALAPRRRARRRPVDS